VRQPCIAVVNQVAQSRINLFAPEWCDYRNADAQSLHRNTKPETEQTMKTFTIMGYTVNNAEQARSVLMVAILKGDTRIADQCRAVIAKFEA
jgi:hypothetical protein